MKYVPENMHDKSNTLDPPIPEVEDKSMHGIFHPQLARWLCPQRDLEEYDKDPECSMQALQAGDITMKSSRWLAGFYENDAYDSKDKTVGLFRNHTVVCFYKHLFLGPAAILSDSTTRRAAKPSKNRAWGLDSVDRYIIAYVHLITYVTISHAQHWTQTIGDMDLQDLYWRIVEMLEDDSDPWVRETLKWWNKHCNPSNGRSTSSMSKKANDDGSSSEDDMAQVRARRAAASSTATKNKTPASTIEYSNAASEAPLHTSRRTEHEVARKKVSAPCIDSDEDLPQAMALSRSRPEAVAHASHAKPRRTEHEVAREKVSPLRVDSDEDLPQAEALSRNRLPYSALPARLKRPEHGAVARERSSMRSQFDKFKSCASTSLINEDDGRDYGNHDVVNAHSMQWDSEIGNNIQDHVDATDGNPDSVADSPLSQLPDDVHDEVTVDAQGHHVQSESIPPARRIKFVFSAAAEENEDTAPPPQKKAKNASTKPQTAPARWNAAHAKRANGF